MISICMATFNGEKYIAEQLQSIYEQTLKVDEVIICDDASTDETVEIAQRFIRHNKLENKWKVYRNDENKGYPGNFYYAMSLCSGDIVFLADQDDIWNKHKIELMADILKEREDIKVLACKYGLIDTTGDDIHTLMSPVKSYESGQLKEVLLPDIFYKYEFPGMVLAYRREWYERRQMDSTSIPHDYLICAMAAEENALIQFDCELAYHRRHSNNVGKEEHRLRKLLNKQRKLKEISEYIKILQALKEEHCLKAPEAQRQLTEKLQSMEGRYQALRSGKRGRVLQNAIRNKEVTRIATVICDLLIVGQKYGDT